MWDIEALGCVGRGASTKRPGEPPAGYLDYLWKRQSISVKFQNKAFLKQMRLAKKVSNGQKLIKPAQLLSLAKLHISIFQTLQIAHEFGFSAIHDKQKGAL
ncbi:hypothetical protein [Reyranella sp.]|uniref:hypothetical protein n=1 Tax=Reyranella sp. TaxID=1929291 RepID=UPI003D0AC5DD